jgi:integrase
MIIGRHPTCSARWRTFHRPPSPVLDADEIVRFLGSVAGLRNRVALTTSYAAGLRIGEVARLKVAVVDSKRMLIHVENGKGGRDRYAMLSPRLL